MDTFTKVTTKGYGSRIKDSIKGILVGLIMFVLSFIILWTNEGSVDLSKIAKTSIEVDSENVVTENNDKLISVSGKINSKDKLGDNLYLKAGEYIAISRIVEMYSWEEKTESDTDKNLGGSETTTTTYKYEKEWTENPDKSSNFEITEGHENPKKKLDSKDFKVSDSNIGKYKIDARNISVPFNTKIGLDEKNIDKSKNKSIKIENGYIFDGKGDINNPQVGDIRITYKVLKNGANVTAMGQQNNDKLVSYSDKNGNKLFRIFDGTRDDAISTLKTEYLIKLRLLRFVGFIFMFIGLTLLLGPISVILDFVPAVGGISRFLISIVSFVVALVLSIITILISIIFHNIFLLIIAIGVIGYLVYIKFKKKYGNNNSNNNTNNQTRESNNNSQNSTQTNSVIGNEVKTEKTGGNNTVDIELNSSTSNKQTGTNSKKDSNSSMIDFDTE